MMKINPNKLRNHILDMIYDKKSGHIGGSFSICDVVTYLYNEYDLINKDKLILSKGHAVPVLYAVFYELGLIDSLDSFREIDSMLQGHPDKNKLKYLHATTGSLGQGLSISIGHAIANKLQNTNNNIFCILGDGELQEGQIWEAFMLAPKYKLDNLLCLIDYNKSQNDDYIKNILDIYNLYDKVKSFNWNVLEIDGHNEYCIRKALKYYESGKNKSGIPMCIILNTVKGKGVSFMETFEWHAKVPNDEEYLMAKKELSNYEGNT
jgi:transketolase